ncbi:hypothetical protein OQA88_11897 [Cercophora sp. LCS_1]
MADPRSGARNGPPTTETDGRDSNVAAQGFTRPFSLYEALPYTPCTSILPFDSDVIPTPSIGSASPAPSLIDLIQSREFDALNEEALGQGAPSKRCQQTASQIQRLLDRGNITEFNFKTGPKSGSAKHSNQPPLASSLSPFSKMVFDNTALAFRYPTPDTPTAPTPDESLAKPFEAIPVAKTPQPTPKVELPKHNALAAPKNKKAHAQNIAKLEVVQPTKSDLERAAGLVNPTTRYTMDDRPAALAAQAASPIHSQQPIQPAATTPTNKPLGNRTPSTPNQPPPKASQGSGSQTVKISVEIGASTIDKSKFAVIPSGPEEVEEDDAFGQSLGLNQRADASLHELKAFLNSVFQAEHHAQSTGSENEDIIFTDNRQTTLSSTAQSKAQKLLSKTISLNCFKRVPLDYLLRLHRLCDGALKQVQDIEVNVDTTWTAADAEQWVQQLPQLETAIRSGRTSLRIMCGGRDDKKLYSEDTIDRCVNLFRRVADDIVIPIAEVRSSGNTAELFKSLASNKKKIATLIIDCQNLFSVMSELLSRVDASEKVANDLESTASRLIFIETAQAERESVIETQKFDGLRLVSMDMLSQIFLLKPAQRAGIFDEILTKFQKLPVGKRARTFKLMDGHSIQPVSALIMRLIQTSAAKVDDTTLGRPRAIQSIEDDEDGPSNPNGNATSFSIRNEKAAIAEHETAIGELNALSRPLVDGAAKNADHVIQYILGRAQGKSKSGEDPHRNLLDLFVEDFTICLDNPDWPSAELLLRLLTRRMLITLKDDKSAVTLKNMALEILGVVAAAISKLRGYVRRTVSVLDVRDPHSLAAHLNELANLALEMKARPEQVLEWEGPYRATVEYLQSRFSDDPHLSSAISYLVSTWGFKVGDCHKASADDSEQSRLGGLAYKLREMIRDQNWLAREDSFGEVPVNEARLAYAITLLRSDQSAQGLRLCDHFHLIMHDLLSSMASDQPTVRSKSLKSINQVLDTDSSILDGDSGVLRSILECSQDSSTQVRDSALGLIGKCLTMRPALEGKLIETIVDRFTDAGPGVRKRAIKLAKDIYLRNSDRNVRFAIANKLLPRIHDYEESVKELSKQVIEEIWFTPFHGDENSAASQTSLRDHVTLMVQTVKRGNVNNVLDKVLQALLAPGSKTAQVSLEVCRKFVACMFDLVASAESSDNSGSSGRDALQVLLIFAKADPGLFTFEQLAVIKPYVLSLSTNDELGVARYVIGIYRRVLSQLSSIHTVFLDELGTSLLRAAAKLNRTLMDDTAACVWSIYTMLNRREKVGRLVLSALKGARVLGQNFQGSQVIQKFKRYALIVGVFAKNGQFEDPELRALFEQETTIAPLFKRRGVENVSNVMVEVFLPFCSPKYDEEARWAALETVGFICQSSPRNYTAPNVYTTFQQIFDSKIPKLEATILQSIRDFLFTEEKRSEQGSEATTVKKRELTVIGGTSYDDVSSGTTQRFMEQFTRIALATQDEHAFLAVEVLASINRQGLVHPKQTGVTFITLATSSNPRISEAAYQQHKALHEKHETVVERDYVAALRAAFEYQRDIVQDPRGARTNPFTSKLYLLMEVLKISKTKNRHKFLEKLCTQVDFDLAKLDMTGQPVPESVQYAQFIIENIAFFEYLTVGEVHAVVTTMEKIALSTGPAVAQAIESEVFALRMDALESTQPHNVDSLAVQDNMESTIDRDRLRRLTAGSMILLALWEARTYLRKLYGIDANKREQKAKLQTKDLSKAPVKSQAVTGDKLWADITRIMDSLSDRQTMLQTCQEFAKLMSEDKEHLVQNDEDEDMNGEEPTTPNGDEDEEMDEPSAGRGRKRKSHDTPGGRKKRARSSSQPRKRGRPPKQNKGEVDADGDFDWA